MTGYSLPVSGTAFSGLFYALMMIDLCRDQRSCTVLASPETFTQDPCVGTPKYLDVHFNCRPNEFKNKTACEDQALEMSCDQGDRIAIYSAMFGRAPSSTDQCPANRQGHIDCQASATSTVLGLCQGKKSCVVSASEDVFGDPCASGINKYLSVSYTCLPRKILKQLHHSSTTNKKKKRKKKKKKDNENEEMEVDDVVDNTTEMDMSEDQPAAPPVDQLHQPSSAPPGEMLHQLSSAPPGEMLHQLSSAPPGEMLRQPSSEAYETFEQTSVTHLVPASGLLAAEDNQHPSENDEFFDDISAMTSVEAKAFVTDDSFHTVAPDVPHDPRYIHSADGSSNGTLSSNDTINSTDGSNSDTVHRADGSSSDTVHRTDGSSNDTINSSTDVSSNDTVHSTDGSSSDTIHTIDGSSNDTVHGTDGSSNDTVHSTYGSSNDIVRSTDGSSNDTVHSTDGSSPNTESDDVEPASSTPSAFDTVNKILDVDDNKDNDSEYPRVVDASENSFSNQPLDRTSNSSGDAFSPSNIGSVNHFEKSQDSLYTSYPQSINTTINPYSGNSANDQESSSGQDRYPSRTHKADIVLWSGYVTERNLTVLCINYTKPDVRWSFVVRPEDGMTVGFLRDWFSAVHFVQEHEEKAWLYFTVGVCFGVIVMLIVVLIKVCINFHRNIRARLDVSEPTHHNTYTHNHSSLEAPMLEHSDSVDRIEVVRFSPRNTLRSHRSNSHHRDLVNYYG